MFGRPEENYAGSGRSLGRQGEVNTAVRHLSAPDAICRLGQAPGGIYATFWLTVVRYSWPFCPAPRTKGDLQVATPQRFIESAIAGAEPAQVALTHSLLRADCVNISGREIQAIVIVMDSI
jgi:hypothetical protein